MSSNTKRMLINATQKEELRVALVDGKMLWDLDIEPTGRTQKKASIYVGRVTRVEPSLDAAFIDYGAEKHGFLPLKEVAKEYFANPSLLENGRVNIKDALKPGQELIVQVDKEERGTKGAALTTFIGLAGCYLVLMPNNPRAGGISRRIEGEERDELKNILDQLPIPDGMGLIVRTAGVGRNISDLKWDLDVLLSQWQAILDASKQRSAPFLVYRESDVIIRALRDYLRPDITEILVDTEDAFQHAKNHIQTIRPDFISRIKLYQDPIPLFNRFQIEHQIESAFKREVLLENGASIAIDPTEALIAIDINSARATEGSDIEDTALQTNLAAAKEIARQLRLRDIGGLIVIDFIDMSQSRNQRMVENQLREELKADRARIQVGRISRFGLLEMSRQRLRPSLGDATQVTCSRCEGQGKIRSIQSLALAITRIVEDESMKENTRQINVQAPVDLAAYLMNEKREMITELEKRHSIRILILANPQMVTPEYQINRLEGGNTNQSAQPSYDFITTTPIKAHEILHNKTEADRPDEPAIKHFMPTTPAPNAISRDHGLIRRLWSAVFGPSEKSEDSSSKHSSEGNTERRDHSRHSRRRNNRGHQQGHKDRNPRRGGEQPKGDRRNRRNRNGQRDDNRQNREGNVREERAPRDHHSRDERAPRDHHHSRDERAPRREREYREREPRHQEPAHREPMAGAAHESRSHNVSSAPLVETTTIVKTIDTQIVSVKETQPISRPVSAPTPVQTESVVKAASTPEKENRPVQPIARPAAPPAKAPLSEAEIEAKKAARRLHDNAGFAQLTPEQKKASVVTLSDTELSHRSDHASASLKQVTTRRDPSAPAHKEEPQKHYLRVTSKEEQTPE